MDREQMITHLALNGWGPCTTLSNLFNCPRIVHRSGEHIMGIGMLGVFRDVIHPKMDIPDNDWTRYTSDQLRKFIAELDVELDVKLDL